MFVSTCVCVFIRVHELSSKALLKYFEWKLEGPLSGAREFHA